MTRIIAGRFGGLRLVTPKSEATRPTSDRVREALFSSLDHDGVLEQARVLDLFAGSGALGLEALSRGAAAVTLVDQSASAIAACRRNAQSILRDSAAAGRDSTATRRDSAAAGPKPAGCEATADGGVARESAERGESTLGSAHKTRPVDVVKSSVGAFLGRPVLHPFDVVFADPPYPLPESELAGLLERLVSAGWLAGGALVVIERSARSPEPDWPRDLRPFRNRKHGETRLWWAEYLLP